MIEAALELAATGRAVFPCAPDKTPLTTRGFKDASTDPDVIRAWPWDSMMGAVIPDDQIVIDIDPRNGGHETLASLHKAGLEWPDTKTVMTAGGGGHLYYRVPPGDYRGKLGAGIDVKLPGKGYVIVPPSNGYLDNVVFSSEVADAPTWLVDMLAKDPERGGGSSEPEFFAQFQNGTPYGLGALKRELGGLITTAEGGRNEALNKASFALGQLSAGGQLDYEYAREQLAQAALAIGLEPEEIAKTIDSGWAAGEREPRQPEPAENESLPAKVFAPVPTAEVDESGMWTDWEVEEPEPPWLVKPFLPEHAYVLVYGATEASKSMVWVGLLCEGSRLGVKASVYSLENPPHTDRDRLRRLRPDPTTFRLTNRTLDLNDVRQLEAMAAREKAFGTDVILLDTYSHAFNSYSDDGNAKAIDFARRVRWLMQEVDCSVVVIDHTGYMRADEPRDASAKRQQVDIAILMEKVGEWRPGQNSRFTMENKKAARFGNPFNVSGEIRGRPGEPLDIVWTGGPKPKWEGGA